MMPWRSAAGYLLAGFALAASPQAAQASDAARPPYLGAYEPQSVDERGLWMEMDEAERGFRQSPRVLRNPQVEQWLRSVLCRTVGDDRCGSTRIYIVRDVSFNASMAPNGMMIVHTGLLLRTNNEAELAAVLGHEFAHFELRHSLSRFTKIRSATDIMAWLSLGGAVTGVATAGAQNMLIAGFMQYNRDQERTSDVLGAQYVKASPYRLLASNNWKRLMEEEDLRRLERGRSKARHGSTDWLDSHPATLERFKYLSEMEAADGTRGDPGDAAYAAAIAPILPDMLADLVKRNDFAAADYIIRNKGEATGWNAALLFARGELFRQRGNVRDLSTARQLYQEALTKPEPPAEAWRGMGVAALRLGDAEEGRKALNEYLNRAPAAQDAAMVRSMLESAVEKPQ